MGSELNIYKIAQEAGVSPATVSRVMTKNARVSEEKRARVEAVIRKYDYRPNALAQGLIKTKTNVIGVLAADLVNPYYSSMVENCEKEIIARGYVPMICGTLSNPDLEVEYIQKMFDMRMDAIIIIGGKSDSLVTEPEYADLINRVAESIPVITTGKVEGGECCQVTIETEKRSEKEYRVTITAAEGAELPKEEAIACTAPAAQKKTVVVISADHMGEGNEELGRALLKAFLFALTQQETLPAAILFYNAGAAVTCEGSASLEDLQALQSQGVEILTCGTCLNFYGLTEKLRVGEVTNMYVIAEKQLQADCIIRP